MRNPAAAEDVQRLRAQMERMQGRRLDAPVLPTHPALAGLLPGRGLRPGAAYSLGSSSSLLFALLAQPSQTGSWCGVVGMPGFGAEAAEHAGVDLSRVVLIPDPGARWLAVTATIADVLPIVAVRPPERAKDSDIAKLADILFTRELQTRFGDRGIAAAEFHPGVVATQFAANVPGPLRWVYHNPIARRLLTTTDEGGARLIFLADGTPNRDWVPGAYYENDRPARSHRDATDAGLARELWDRSAEMVGLAR